MKDGCMFVQGGSPRFPPTLNGLPLQGNLRGLRKVLCGDLLCKDSWNSSLKHRDTSFFRTPRLHNDYYMQAQAADQKSILFTCYLINSDPPTSRTPESDMY